MMKRAVIVSLIAAAVWGADEVATVKNVSGDVQVKRGEVYTTVRKGEYLYAGDLLLSGAGSSVGVTFNDGTVVSLGPRSLFTINAYRFKPSTREYAFRMSLARGSAAVKTGKIGKLSPQSVSFAIPQGSVGIRGTAFIVEAEE